MGVGWCFSWLATGQMTSLPGLSAALLSDWKKDFSLNWCLEGIGTLSLKYAYWVVSKVLFKIMKQIQKLLLIGKCLGKRCLNPGWLSEDTYRNRQTDRQTHTHKHTRMHKPLYWSFRRWLQKYHCEQGRKKSLPLTKMFKCILASWSRTIKNSCWEPGRKKILKDVKLYVVWMWLVISAGSFSHLGVAIRVSSLHLWVTT